MIVSSAEDDLKTSSDFTHISDFCLYKELRNIWIQILNNILFKTLVEVTFETELLGLFIFLISSWTLLNIHERIVCYSFK